MKQLPVRRRNRFLTQDSARRQCAERKTPAAAFTLLMMLVCSLGACNGKNGIQTVPTEPKREQDAKLEEVKTDIQNLRNTKADQKSVDGLASDLESLQKELRGLTTEMDRQKRATELTTRIRELTTEIESAKKKLEPLDTKIGRGEPLTPKQAQEYADLKVKFSNVEREKKRLESEWNSLKAKPPVPSGSPKQAPASASSGKAAKTQ